MKVRYIFKARPNPNAGPHEAALEMKTVLQMPTPACKIYLLHIAHVLTNLKLEVSMLDWVLG